MTPDALATFTDPAAVARLLTSQAGAAFGAQAAIRDVRLLHAWRRTWAKADRARRGWLTTCYAVEFTPGPHAALETCVLHGHAEHCEPAGVVAPAAAAGAVADVPAIGWPLALHTAAARMTLRRFPDDPAMPQLAQLYAARATHPGDDTAGGLQARLVSYRPGVRCTLVFVDAAGRARRYAKTFADVTQAREVARRLELLQCDRRERGDGPGVLRLPTLLADAAGGAHARHTVWTAALGGLPPDASPAGAFGPRGLGLVVDALRELHATPLPGLPRAERAVRLEEAGRKLRKMARRHPGAAAAAGGALQRCAALLDAPDVARLPLRASRHGDVHAGQFLVDAGRVALFDLDELALGDPEEDLAALSVAMVAPRVALPLASSPPPPAGPWLARFAERHARQASAPVAALLEFHLRLQWIDRAYRSDWRHGEDAAGLVDGALRRAVEDVP